MREGCVAVVVILVLLASGCTQQTNETANETEFEYVNSTESIRNEITGNNFKFNIYGESEFWLKQNDTIGFHVVFNNNAEDGKAHNYIARMYPLAADFYVMAAYKCEHFMTCSSLLKDMRNLLEEPANPQTINYSYVGLSEMKINIPEDAASGTYIYSLVACRDMEYAQCTQERANLGPEIPVTVHVI